MNIEKVIKVYFVSVMSVVAIAALSYNDTMNRYMTSVFMTDWMMEEQVDPYAGLNSRLPRETYVPELMMSNVFGASTFMAPNENPYSVNFEILNDPVNSFYEPGTEGAHLMTFKVRPQEEDFGMTALKLKISGMNSDYVEKVYLRNGEEFVTGRIKDGYVSFSSIGFNVPAGETGELFVLVDLSEDVLPGERLRMDIEKSEDIAMYVGNQPYALNEFYPLFGKYLSVAKKRVVNYSRVGESGVGEAGAGEGKKED